MSNKTSLSVRKVVSSQEQQRALDFRQQHFFDRLGFQDPYRWVFNEPQAHVHWLLYVDDQPIGYIHIQIWPDHRAALRIIVIDENFRGRGYGRHLIEFCEQALRDDGTKLLQTEASPTAYSFYEKLGYTDMQFNDPEREPTHPDDRAMGKYL